MANHKHIIAVCPHRDCEADLDFIAETPDSVGYFECPDCGSVFEIDEDLPTRTEYSGSEWIEAEGSSW